MAEKTTPISLTNREILSLLACMDLVDREIVGWKLRLSDYDRKKTEWEIQDKLKTNPEADD